MGFLRVGLRGEQRHFRPGETIAGAVQWETDAEVRSGEIRFFWRTEGKGTQDISTVGVQALEHPGRAGVEEFHFQAPAEPVSFSGRLLSVRWAVELVLEPGRRHAAAELEIGPEGRELILPRVEAAR